VNIVFAGTPAFAVPSLRALAAVGHTLAAVYTQPDRPAGRGRRAAKSAIKQAALELRLPVQQPPKMTPQTAAGLQQLVPDVMVVVAYGLILPEIVLRIPAHGCINVHASLLPRWRGAAPIARAIEAGDTVTGITIMQMDAGLDTGDMLAQCQTPISEDDTAQTVHDRLAELGAILLVQTLDKVATGTIAARPQDHAAACYAAKIRKADALLNWDDPAVVLHRRVRAFNPWPVAYTHFRGRILRIWEVGAVAPDAGREVGLPGTLVAVDRSAIYVSTGAGILPIRRLQLEGGKSLDVQAFVNGYHPKPGERLT
jgi:methionyl-tRNA formyltransferase